MCGGRRFGSSYFKNNSGFYDGELSHFYLQIEHSENELKIYYADLDCGDFAAEDWLTAILSDNEGRIKGSYVHQMIADHLTLRTQIKQGLHIAQLQIGYCKGAVMFYYAIDYGETIAEPIQEPLQKQIESQIIIDL